MTGLWGKLWGRTIVSYKLLNYFKNLVLYVGGEGGIRTPDTLARMPHFECGAIDHSATSPVYSTFVDR